MCTGRGVTYLKWLGWGLGLRVLGWVKGLGLVELCLDWISIKGPVWLILITRTNFVIIRKLRGCVWHFSKVFHGV